MKLQEAGDKIDVNFNFTPEDVSGYVHAARFYCNCFWVETAARLCLMTTKPRGHFLYIYVYIYTR